jgi:hypothetical protein
MCLFQKGRPEDEHGSSENPAAQRAGTPHRARVIIFRVVAVLAGIFFVVAVVLMASAPWVLLQPDQQTRTELNRWFLTVPAVWMRSLPVCCSPSHCNRAGHC